MPDTEKLATKNYVQTGTYRTLSLAEMTSRGYRFLHTENGANEENQDTTYSIYSSPTRVGVLYALASGELEAVQVRERTGPGTRTGRINKRRKAEKK